MTAHGYIVVLRSGVSQEDFLGSLNLDANSSITMKYYHVVNGFAETDVEALKGHPDVEILEKDSVGAVFDHQMDAPWGLGRICRISPLRGDPKALNFFYHWDQLAGTGTDIYIVDSGIDTSHPGFEGRATWGATFVGESVDTSGHGTHVAGIAISKQYGVAKAAHAIAVKVAEGDSYYTSALVAGLEWICVQVGQTQRPSVVNISMGGDVSPVIDAAVKTLFTNLIPVVAAAGNSNKDARTVSPARSPYAITVGASNISDKKWAASNWGHVLNVWAPGQDIISTWLNGGVMSCSGTSMAAPHVSGLLAYLLSLRTRVPMDFWAYAHAGFLKGIPAGTANLLIYNNHYDLNDEDPTDEDLYGLNWVSLESVQNQTNERIRGGIESSGGWLYVGRGTYAEGIHPGKLRADTGEFLIGYGGKEIKLDQYELLVGSQTASQWVRVEGSFSLDKLACYLPVTGGNESDDAPLYVIQGFYENGVHCGKVRDGGLGLIPYGGQEISLSTYNVLAWESPPPVRKMIGRYMTMYTNWQSITQGNEFTAVIPIAPSAPTAPRVVVGLNYVDLSYPDDDTHQVARIHAYVDNIDTSQFTAHIGTWSTSKLYNGGVSWLQLASTDSDFQCDVFSCQEETTETILFDWRYEVPPIVFVGLCGFDIGDNPRISVYADNIDRLGFKIHAEKWGSTDFYGCRATWVAFPANKEGIRYGKFSAGSTTEASTGSITFSPPLERSPRVFTALTKFDVDANQNIRIRVDAENISVKGMDWRISTWGGSTLYETEAAYIALV